MDTIVGQSARAALRAKCVDHCLMIYSQSKDGDNGSVNDREEGKQMNNKRRAIEGGSRPEGQTPVDSLVMPVFGQVVSVTDKYRRRERRGQNGGTYKYWDITPFFSDGCIFLGTRTLQDGIRDYDHEYGYQFAAHHRFKAALVCPGPLRKPVLVPLASIKA